MAKIGRKSKLTPELQEQFVVGLKNGHYAETVCEALSIHKATYYRWLEKGEAYHTLLNAGPPKKPVTDDKALLAAWAQDRRAYEEELKALEPYSDFRDAVKSASAKAEERALRLILEAAEPFTKTVVDAKGNVREVEEKGQWQAAAWYLERTKPKRYGRRIEVEDKTPRAADSRGDQKTLTDAELKAALGIADEE